MIESNPRELGEPELELKRNRIVMGNFFGRKKGVHPVDQADGIRVPSSYLRIRVRMSKRKLKEMMAQVDLTQGNSDLGGLIMQECLEGRLNARAVCYGIEF